MRHIGAHGSITRSQAAELCALTSQEASSLLRRMAGAGTPELRGERRTSHYTRPGLLPQP